MTATRQIRIEVDDRAALASVAQLDTRIRNIGSGNTAGLGNLQAALNAMGQANPGLGQIVNNLQGTSGAASAAGNAAQAASGRFGALGASARAAMTQLGGMTGSMGGIATAGLAIGATAVIGGLVGIGAAAVRASAQFEAYKASLTTVLGDSDKASQAFDRLTQFAAKTPFSLDQSVQGFIKLKALGLQPTEAAMTSYGNTASAMGKDLNQMVEAVADAATGEFERLKEFGIKSKIQGDQVAFTFQGVTTKVKNNSTDIQKYLMGIGNTNFAGAMEKQMATFNGAMSNLSDTWTQTMAAIGDGGFKDSIAQVVTMLTNGLGFVTPLLTSIFNGVGGIVEGLVSMVAGIGTAFNAIQSSSTTGITFMEAFGATFRLIGEAASLLGSIIGAVFGAVASVVQNVSAYMTGSFGGVLSFLGVSFENGGRSWGNSIMGVLRAVKAVVGLMPRLFSLAVNDVMRMFRDLGSGIMAFLSGDWAKGISFFQKDQFSNTQKGLDAVGKTFGKVYSDVKGADAATARLLGRKPKTKGASLDDLAGPAPKPTPSAGKPDDKKDKADEEAKKAAARLKKENEYWQTLTETAKVAAMLPQEAERYNKELELRKIWGDGDLDNARQLTQTEKDRLATILQTKASNEISRNIQAATLETQREGVRLTEQARISATGTVEQVADNLAIEERLWPFKKAALEAGIKLEDANLQRQLAQLSVAERHNLEIDKRNKLLADTQKAGIDYAKGSVSTDGTSADRRALAKDTLDKQMATLRSAVGKVTPAEFRAGVAKATREYQDTMSKIGNEFANKLSGVLGQMGNIIGGKLGAFMNKGADAVDAYGSFGATKDDVSGKLQGLFGSSASPAIKGISNAVGGAMAGLQIGESIASLGKAIGLKTSATGGKIGGAIGGAAFGPVGAAVGGALGSIVGGLFKKSKNGSAGLNVIDGQAVAGAATGHGKSAIGTAAALATSVAAGINGIASKLGAKVGDLSGVSVGYRPGHTAGAYRVDPTGKGSVKGGSVMAFEDEAEAIAAAIKLAISKGALTGLSDLVNKAIGAMDIDSAIQLSQDWTSLMDDLASRLDPVGAAITAVTKPLDAFRATMVSVGASAADLTKLDQLKALQLQDLYKQQTQGYRDFISTLNGDGAGVSKVTQLNADLTKFDAFKTDIAAGKTVNQDDFTTLGQKIFSEASSVWGTQTSQFQDIRTMLMAATTGAANNVKAGFDDATVAAIDKGNDMLAAQLAINNDYQAQILEAIQNGKVVYIGQDSSGSNSRANQA